MWTETRQTALCASALSRDLCLTTKVTHMHQDTHTQSNKTTNGQEPERESEHTSVTSLRRNMSTRIQQTFFSKHRAVQSKLLIFDDAIWYGDQNRLHPVCIVRPKTELPQRWRERWKERRRVSCMCSRFLSTAPEDGSRPILLSPSNVPLSFPSVRQLASHLCA